MPAKTKVPAQPKPAKPRSGGWKFRTPPALVFRRRPNPAVHYLIRALRE